MRSESFLKASTFILSRERFPTSDASLSPLMVLNPWIAYVWIDPSQHPASPRAEWVGFRLWSNSPEGLTVVQECVCVFDGGSLSIQDSRHAYMPLINHWVSLASPPGLRVTDAKCSEVLLFELLAYVPPCQCSLLKNPCSFLFAALDCLLPDFGAFWSPNCPLSPRLKSLYPPAPRPGVYLIILLPYIQQKKKKWRHFFMFIS